MKISDNTTVIDHGNYPMGHRPKRLDPDQRFIISATTRQGIADDLNEYLNERGSDLGLVQIPMILGDDPLLTDSVCETYAASLGEITDEDDDVVEEQYARLRHSVLVNLGLLK